mmetsp:Transcript_24523/g.77121  ORF Transcript_24523/g.77121 Transcript_24523/m.77121 type:complete len:396 (-) Transcript_24523:303-1490(-)
MLDHLPQPLLRLGRQPLLDELPAAREVLVERVVREVSCQLRVGEIRVRVAPVRRHWTPHAALAARTLAQIVDRCVVHVLREALVAREVAPGRALQTATHGMHVRRVAQTEAARALLLRPATPASLSGGGGRQLLKARVHECRRRRGPRRGAARRHRVKEAAEVWRAVKQHLRQRDTERVDVRRCSGPRASGEQLRREVALGPAQRERLSDAARRVEGHVEVREAGSRRVVHQNVVRLDVAVVHRMRVQVGDCGAQRLHEGGRLQGGGRARPPPLAQRAVPVERHLQMHRRVRVRHVAKDRLDRHNSGVTEAEQQRRLLVAVAAPLRVHRVLLQHDRPAILELRVAHGVAASARAERAQIRVNLERALRVEDRQQLARRCVRQQAVQLWEEGEPRA